MPQSSFAVEPWSWSHCVRCKASQQLAEQTAVLCCHLIRTGDTDFSDAICLCLLVFIETCADDDPVAPVLIYLSWVERGEGVALYM